ncbi:sensor histidine kinase [Azohydromonas lata]|uniref:sensor histidine kinase n=1 Tax=Azohydromonas lata TaxID=45677 RepID=UPI000830568A|nr:ATP-binding protein [Azohydromonas lata]
MSDSLLRAPLPPRQAEQLREHLVLAVAALAIVLLSTAAALMLWRQRAHTQATWERYMQSFATSMAAHAQQVAYAADGALQRVVERVQEEAGDSEARLHELATTRRMHDFLTERRGEPGVARDIAIVDLQGQVLANNQAFPAPHINVHDRDYFKAHLAQPALDLYLSAPVLSRDTGRWTLFLVRKLRAGDGRMLGLVITGVEVACFERFYQSVNLDDAHTAVQLLRSDGVPLARHPLRAGMMSASYRGAPALRALEQALAQGRRSAAVYTRQTRPSDPALADQRLVVARAVDAFPLVVVTLATQDLMLHGWRQTAWFLGVGTALLDALIALLALWMHRSLRRRRQDMERLAADHGDKASFLAGVSGELRASLLGLQDMTRRLAATAPALAPQRQALHTMERSATQLMALVDDLRDYSRLETGRLALQRAPFAIAPVVQDCLALFQSQARSRGVALELYMGNAAHDTPVLGDAPRLAQIVNNLLSNALRFTSTGHVALSVAPLDRERWRVAVSDTGSGMTAEQCRRLFEPLPAPHAAESGAPGTTPGLGLGLGLSIVKRLALLHEGTVGVRSELGQGTEVWCELLLPPAAVAPSCPATPPAAAEAAAEAT